jgi:hypothetical protein
MTTFTYQYWDEKGAVRSGTLRAADRTEALRQIQTAGRSVISLTEGHAVKPGWFRPHFPSWGKPALVLMSFVLLLFFSADWIVGMFRKPDTGNPARHTATGTQAPARLPVPLKTPPRDAKTETVPGDATPHASIQPPVANTAARKTSPASAPSAKTPGFRPPPSEADAEPLPPNAFKNQSDALLAMAMSVPPGMEVPPLPIPDNLDETFLHSLTNDIVIYPEDDARTVELKKTVADAKQQIREMVNEGRSVAEILSEYRRQMKEQAALRREALKELHALYRSGAVNEAKTFHDQVNEAFSKTGIPPIEMPRDWRRTAP